jgi:C-terminal processing protease CtpA/Prc
MSAFIPNGRPINPITKTDWEGVGVKPDVVVPADKALETAHQLARAGLAATASTRGSPVQAKP